MQIEQTIRPAESAPLVSFIKSGAVLLDVRTHCEHAGYHILGAVNIPYDEIDRLIDLIKRWEKPVITFSGYGRRSEIATRKLKAHGVQVCDGGTVGLVEQAIESARSN